MLPIKERILKIRKKQAVKKEEVDPGASVEIKLIEQGKRFYQNFDSEEEAQEYLKLLRDIYKKKTICFVIEPFAVLFQQEHLIGRIKSSDWYKGKGFSIWFSPPNLKI